MTHPEYCIMLNMSYLAICAELDQTLLQCGMCTYV